MPTGLLKEAKIAFQIIVIRLISQYTFYKKRKNIQKFDGNWHMHAMMHWIGCTRWFILNQFSFLIHTENFNSDMADLKLLLEAADDGNPDIYQYFQIYFLLIWGILLSIFHDMFNIPHFPLHFLNTIVCSLHFPNLSISVK